MAEVKSGSFNTTGYNDPGWPDYYVFAWTLTKQSIVDNTSTISWTLKGAGADNSARYTVVSEKYVTVNGETKSSDASQTTYNGTVAFSGETVIKHGADGKCRFSASAGGAFYYSGSYNSEGSGSWDLPTIARASTITLSSDSVNLGESITVTLKAADSGFYHEVKCGERVKNEIFSFSLGNNDGISPRGVNKGTEFTFTPDAEHYGPLIRDSLTFTIVAWTYRIDEDGYYEEVGKSYADVNVVVPDYIPKITLKTQYKDTLNGKLVQNKSSVTIDIDFETYYGATLKNASAVFDGIAYQSLPLTAVVKRAGEAVVRIKATDSRGRGGTWTYTLDQVYEYAPPQITEFTLERQSDGTTVIATVKGTIAPVNNVNAKTVRVTIGSSSIPKLAASYSVNETITFTGVPTDNTLAAKCELIDSFNASNPAKKEAVLPTVAVTMDFHHSGKGVAFGKVAEYENTLDVAWDARIKGRLYMGDNKLDDFVIERGTSDGWNYTKWLNGKIELYADKSLTFPSGSLAETGAYRSVVTIELSGILTTILSGNCPVQHNGTIPQVCRHSTYQTRAEIVILANRGFAGFTITVPIYIIGRWK